MDFLNSNCNLVIDIGGGKFDHHQKDVKEKRNNGISYASAGLVWKEFGRLVINRVCSNQLSQNEIEEIFCDIDMKIIQNVDMEDNGELINNHPFMFINLFLPNWTETDPNYDLKFEKALQLSIDILKQYIEHNVYLKLGSNEIEKRIQNEDTKINNILVLPSQTIPWQEKVISYNETQDIPIDFVVFPYPAGGYALQCVPLSMNDIFSQRIPLPKKWAGETTNLSELSNVPSAILCHKGRFFARAGNFEDIITMCEIATFENKSDEQKLNKKIQ